MRRGGSSRSERDKLDPLLGFAHESPPPEEVVTIPTDITALAVSHKSAAYCAGNMSGALQMGDAEGKWPRIPPSYKSPVELVAWSWDDKYVAIAKFGNSISIRVNLPSNSQLLLGFPFNTLSALRWQDLQKEYQLNILPAAGYVVVHEAIEPSTRAALDSVPSIHKVFTNYDGSITFLQISPLSLADSATDEFFILHDVRIKRRGPMRVAQLGWFPCPGICRR